MLKSTHVQFLQKVRKLRVQKSLLDVCVRLLWVALLVSPFPAFASISRDSFVNPSIANPGTSLTWSATVAGPNPLVYVAGLFRSNNCSGATFNGVSMTQIGSQVGPDINGDNFCQWYITGITGTHNVVISMSGSNIIIGGSISYDGVSQSSPLDGHATVGPNTATSWTPSITTVADNAWGSMMCRSTSNGNTSAGTGTTLVANTSGFIQLYDSNGGFTPAGSHSLQCTDSSQEGTALMATFAPEGSAVATLPALQMMYGWW